MKTRKIIATIVLAAMTIGAFTGCSTKQLTSTNRLYAATIQQDAKYDEHLKGYLDFAMTLAKTCAKDNDENILISPASVLFALEMTAAGTSNMTLEEIAQAIIPDATPEEVQDFTAQYMNTFDGDYFNLANSIWIDNKISDGIYDDYKNFLKDRYGAEINECDLPASVNALNNWISEKTKGRIQHMIDPSDITENTLEVLINAITFDGVWATEISEDDVFDQTFYNADGTTVDTSFLHGEADAYIFCPDAIGFLKNYDGDKYAFMAFVPTDDTITANEYLANMTGEDFAFLFNSRNASGTTRFSMPEFESQYRSVMNDNLIECGIEKIFGGEADFSATGPFEPGDLFVSKVIHQTMIKVNREGTEAAAATAVVCETMGAMDFSKTHIVEVDRPFVYAIVDTETGTPVFTGTINNM